MEDGAGGAEAEQKYIVCNADEGDSGTFADRMIKEGDPFTLIEGMVIAGLGVGATKGFVYLRSEYPDGHCQWNRGLRRNKARPTLQAWPNATHSSISKTAEK